MPDETMTAIFTAILENHTKEQLAAMVCDLRDVVRDCGIQFKSYELSHRRKRTVDGDLKATINKHYAERCEKALEFPNAPTPS